MAFPEISEGQLAVQRVRGIVVYGCLKGEAGSSALLGVYLDNVTLVPETALIGSDTTDIIAATKFSPMGY